MTTIKSVAIVGGTHGNEFSGIVLVKKWQQQPDMLKRKGVSVRTVFANPEAYKANKRYNQSDLNRQFKQADLANAELANYEQSRAKVINQLLGPKGASQTDLVIDLHNTTSNMGPCLILPQTTDFYRQLGAYVKLVMPDAVILLEDEGEDNHYLCSTGRYGVMVEVGPQPQSVIRQDVLEWMETMTAHILDFVELLNQGKLPKLPRSTEAFYYTETLKLPVDENGQRQGMVHSYVQDNDFKPLNPGDPIFKLFDGQEICYQGDQTVYPHFINEAAYYDNNLAMSLAVKTLIELD